MGAITVRLHVLTDYASATQQYVAGQIIDVTEEQAAALIADSPGTFAREQAPVREWTSAKVTTATPKGAKRK